MNVDRFERLVCDWLDAPQRADLRRALDEAAVRSPALGHAREDWQRLHALVKGAFPVPPHVSWRRQRSEIMSRIAESAD